MEIWSEKLISEYKISKKKIEEYRDSLNANDPSNEEEFRIISEMISDMQYSIDWMRRGRRPGTVRGIDKRSIYQRRALLNMDLFPAIDMQPKQVYLNEEQKLQLINILVDFSYRERECYLLHMAYGLSMSEIAKELSLSKRTVQQYVDRAKIKVKLKVS
jgi:RNA polymerase sigma factor (sigma-70 family)